MQHSYGQYKAGFGSAGLDIYKSYPASPAVCSIHMDNTRQGLEVLDLINIKVTLQVLQLCSIHMDNTRQGLEVLD